MKTNAIVRIVLFSLAIVILLGILLTGIFADTFSFSSRIGTQFDETLENGTISSTGSVDKAEISEIDIEWVSGTIRLQSGDVDRIEFSESGASGEDSQMVWEHSGRKLRIQFTRERFSSLGLGITLNNDLTKDLTITVPRDWKLEDLSITVASANVGIENVTIGEMEFDGVSGVCELTNCIINALSVDTVSGDIQFTGSLNVLDCEAVSANCSLIVTNTPSRIDLESVSGDLDLTLPEWCGFIVSMDALSGDFFSDFSVTQSNGAYVYGDGTCKISIDAMSGDVQIRKSASEPNPTIPSPNF